jgi:carbonic anhydrase/acetyltransferase-like protein (isoleucine patch superfamily)
MVMGSPAKVKRALTEDEIAGIRDNVQSYIDLAAIYKRTQG